MPTPEDLNPDMYIGISLPITNGDTGFFNSTKTHLQQASSNLRNLILTTKGESPMQPEFGCDLWKQVFDPQDEAIEQKVKDSIEEATRTWLPYLHIKQCKVVSTFTEIDSNILHIEVIFSLLSDPDSYESLTFNVKDNFTH